MVGIFFGDEDDKDKIQTINVQGGIQTVFDLNIEFELKNKLFLTGETYGNFSMLIPEGHNDNFTNLSKNNKTSIFLLLKHCQVKNI